jgi:hypothetical protein
MDKNLILKISASISFVAMVTVNVMANALPINNRNTGQISDDYANLFAPAGITFAIWGLIYLLLLGFVVYQFFPISNLKTPKKEDLLNKINVYFIATSLANIFWIFSWHYDFIGISVLLMLSLLFFLIRIADIIRKEKLTSQEKIFISLPFSVYFGWITVATIANITVFLVSISWSGFGISDYFWTSFILLIGALIGILRMRKDRNIAYGLVLIWAYLGILYKHLSQAEFAGMYPIVIITTIICLTVFIITVIILGRNIRFKKSTK